MQASTADPRRRVLRIIAVVVLGAALAMTVVSCGSAATPTTQPGSHALGADAPIGIEVDSPTSGATVQSPVRVTGTIAGGATVNVSLQIVSDDETVIATWAEQLYNTGARVTFDQSLPYAPSFAGKAARIVITLSVMPAGGPLATYSSVVPITLQ